MVGRCCDQGRQLISDNRSDATIRPQWNVAMDVARACLFLGSEAADYVNGQILAADGGWAVAGAGLPSA